MTFQQLGPYRITRRLGRGGMGVVYEGVEPDSGRQAAIKVLSTDLSEEEDFRNRFEAEIDVLRKLKHPNIVRLFGFGEHEGHLFYAMELVDGPSLENELRHSRPFHWREVTEMGIQVCRGLRHAHDRGVIHRDIKPGNLLVAGDGTVKLSDFGIAQLFGRDRITSVGSIVGTIEYMAPEQGQSQLVDHRADLYSLGGVMYALLAQRPPIRAKSVSEMLEKHRSSAPEPLRDLASEVPEPLEQTISQLLERQPERRIPNALVLGRRLEEILHGFEVEPAEDEDFRVSPEASAPGPASAYILPATRGMDSQVEPDLVIGAAASAHAAGPPRESPSQAAETRDATAAHVPQGGEESLAGEPRAVGAPSSARIETAELVAPVAEEELPPEKPTHFTPVAEEDLDRDLDGGEEGEGLISAQTWLLAAALLAVGLTVWYFLQPPTADRLYERIMEQTRDHSIDSLRAAEPRIEEFLARFPDDDRVGEVRRLEREIELDRMERRYELRAAGRLRGGAPLSPCERALVEALSYARLDPDLGTAKLRALLHLYDSGVDPSGPIGKCLEIARRRLERLEEDLEERVPAQIDLIRDRLERADTLEETEPGQARRIRRSVIALYGDKPWARELVERAEAGLE